MSDVGELEHRDLRLQISRKTLHYEAALQLARTVIESQNRNLAHGGALAWTFLIRTPEMVEAGIRRVIADNLQGAWVIDHQGRRLGGSTMTVNPDLVFDSGAAIADVKYKRARHEWRRPDLYQAVAFAEAYETSIAALIEFSPTLEHLDPVQVGGIRVDHLVWVSDPSVPPEHAARLLCIDVRAWLDAEKPRKRGQDFLAS
jgi:5-methylcytosine-specific restriction endonuclease McrBC regulatory subunit McrC